LQKIAEQHSADLFQNKKSRNWVAQYAGSLAIQTANRPTSRIESTFYV